MDLLCRRVYIDLLSIFSDRSEDSRIADDHGISVWTLWKNASTLKF